MNSPLVFAVILNTNRRDDTLACLESLSSSTYRNFNVIVLDNRSTDGSVDAIRLAFPEVQVVSLASNLGYAGNNNVGIELALKQGAEWIWVLNEDTIFEPECLARLVEVGEGEPQIGIVGPMVYHHNEPEVIQSAGGVLGKFWESRHLGQNEVDQGQFQSPHRVEWISGCAILVRCAVIEQVGALDAGFFIYWEETEWCIRAAQGGWKIFHVPSARLWHKGVQREYQPKPAFTYYGTRNHLFTLAKHKAPAAAWLYTIFQLVRTLISWTIKPRWRFKREHRDAMWRGMMDFLRHRAGQMPA
jgi:GT2 family glycosyltransferase